MPRKQRFKPSRKPKPPTVEGNPETIPATSVAGTGEALPHHAENSSTADADSRAE